MCTIGCEGIVILQSREEPPNHLKLNLPPGKTSDPVVVLPLLPQVHAFAW